jgi:hypothetical protein
VVVFTSLFKGTRTRMYISVEAPKPAMEVRTISTMPKESKKQDAKPNSRIKVR